SSSSLVEYFARNDARSSRASALQNLQAAAEEIEAAGFFAVTIANSTNMVVARSGEELSVPEIALRLKREPLTRLIWDGRFALETRVPIDGARGLHGVVTMQRELPDLGRMLDDISEIGDTGELLICATGETN